MRSLIAALILGLKIAAANAATGDLLYVQDNNVALRAAPAADAPVAFRVNRSYRLIERDRQGDWVRVEPHNIRTAGGEIWVQDAVVGPWPRDAARAPQPPSPSDMAGCRSAREAGCPAVTVIIHPERRSFVFFPVKPVRPGQDSTSGRVSGGIVPPFSSGPVPPFSTSPVPPLVPSR